MLLIIYQIMKILLFRGIFFVVLITNYAKKSVTLPTRVSCTLNLILINDTESLSMLAICRFVLTHEITINISNLHNYE